MKFLIDFLKSSVSGALIVIGCTVNLSADTPIVGALLFTVALCSICTLGLPLYTGAVGFAESLKDSGSLGFMLLGNMAGCAVAGLAVSVALPDISVLAATVVERKIYPAHISLILSVICGILMYIAVYTYRSKNIYIGIFLCVPTFIIASFEHSIAFMGYMAIGRAVSLQILISMIIFVAGNSIGAVLLHKIVNMKAKSE